MTSAKKKTIIFLAILVLVLAVVAGVRVFSGEDGWICEGDKLIKHGNPSEPKPEIGCGVGELGE